MLEAFGGNLKQDIIMIKNLRRMVLETPDLISTVLGKVTWSFLFYVDQPLPDFFYTSH